MLLNRARFYNVIYNSTFDVHDRFNIGTYKEKKLHIILKKYFEEDTAYHEIPTEGFIADIRRDGEIIEIETAGFSGLKPKLEAYLPKYKVNLVHPLMGLKYVSWIDPDGKEISPRHKSPKKENAYDVLFEMVRVLPYVADPNLTVIAPILEVDEYRMLDGWSNNRKKGSSRYERIPVDILDMLEFSENKDFLKYIPDTCPESFSVSDFSREAKIDYSTANAVMKVMEARGVVKFEKKVGRSRVFTRVTD